ncbi:UvrD-helicase domain-containing protein [Thermopirellula anaerolimosa]
MAREDNGQSHFMNDADLLSGLTPSQREAVTHVDGPLLILAGPGSGKTRVVTHRIAYLLRQGIPGENILGLTFTNKAAAEMASRVEQLAPGTRVWLGTFHRFAAQFLRRYGRHIGLQANFTIYDKEDSLKGLRRVIAEAGVDLMNYTPDTVAAAIGSAKSAFIQPHEYSPRDGSPMGSIVQKVYPLYQRWLSRSNAVDFDDLLLNTAIVLQRNPELRRELDARHRYVMVDEYQDTNLVQYAIARALSIDHPNLAVTGDPDQSIYGWRGADLNNILEFERDFPQVRVVRLEQNYRSTKKILRAAAGLIAHNVKRKRKDLFTLNDDGADVRLVAYRDQTEEAEDIASRIQSAIRDGRRRARDFAVFYRVNALSREFELALRRRNIPYQIVNGVEFFQRREIKDLVAYLKFIQNPRDEVAFLRIINNPPRGIGNTTVAHVLELARSQGWDVWTAIARAESIPGLQTRAATKLAEFVKLIDNLTATASGPIEELLGCVLAETGYRELFRKSSAEEDQERLANVEELLTYARQFDEQHPEPGGLDAFLEEVSLVNDVDAWEEDDRVTLMSLHASKGLEFPVVFLTAVEQGILPHERSLKSNDQMEEERRLMFVGMTRAMEELQISYASTRDFRGQRRLTIPSPFLMELPKDCVQTVGRAAEVAGTAMRSGWDRERPQPQLRRNGVGPGPRLTTAAALVGSAASGPVRTDDYVQDMLVAHPRHGVGRIVALSGSGDNRKATVDFGGRIGRVKFILAKAGLKPLKRSR